MKTIGEQEREAYISGNFELANALAKRCDLESEIEGLKDEMRLDYERVEEQSGFRRDLIEQILCLCESSGSKKDLVKAIKTAYENSYVEI